MYFLQSKFFNIWSVIFLFVFRIWENEEKNVHDNFLSVYYMGMNMTFKCDLQIERNLSFENLHLLYKNRLQLQPFFLTNIWLRFIAYP